LPPRGSSSAAAQQRASSILNEAAQNATAAEKQADLREKARQRQQDSRANHPEHAAEVASREAQRLADARKASKEALMALPPEELAAAKVEMTKKVCNCCCSAAA
jgi:hypothetical protein